MALLFRLLPLIIGMISAGCFAMQAQYANWYPWILVPAFIVFIGGIATMFRQRHWGWEDVRLAVPALMAFAAAGFGMLLVEGWLRYWGIPLFVGLVSYLLVELLFLSTFYASKYPVNGMTHMNLALVPVIFWLLAYTSSGLLVFMNTQRFSPMILFAVVGGVLWYVTAHPEATPESRLRWTLIGAWISTQIGMIIAIVPLRMEVHAMIASICGAAALRVRRYGIAPPIPRNMILLEVIGMILFLAAVAFTAAWR
ncbi:MAG: hypothetical protein KIH65_004200 [Candidatus Uhrbacteria bacterium]|nr:hypothetical protein [Candidatus Uhrbacteria bacterium]